MFRNMSCPIEHIGKIVVPRLYSDELFTSLDKALSYASQIIDVQKNQDNLVLLRLFPYPTHQFFLAVL